MLQSVAIVILLSAAVAGLTEKAIRHFPSGDAVAASVKILDEFMADVGFAREQTDPFTVNGKRFGGLYQSEDCDGQVFVVLLFQAGDNLSLLRSVAVSDEKRIRYFIEDRIYVDFPRYGFWLRRQARDLQSVFQTSSHRRFDVVLGVFEMGNCHLIEAVPWKSLWATGA